MSDDLAALVKSLASGNLSGARTDLASLQVNLADEDDVAGTARSGSSLDRLVAKVAVDLRSGSTDAALLTVADYLVQGGQGSGSLLNVTA